MNQEIFSPDDLDQFQFSSSDRNSERTERTSTQPKIFLHEPNLIDDLTLTPKIMMKTQGTRHQI